nr:hypothetical protein [uncultured Comamonas sp.]
MNPGTKGLRRTGFKSQGKGFKAGKCCTVIDVDAHIVDGDERFVVQDDDRHAARAARQMDSAKETKELICKVGLMALVSTDIRSCAPIVKECAIRHEGYRRLVASMRCCWCGREGRSNHAHENEGKGMGLKVDDRRAMPLCVDDMGQHGCHTAFDQYSLIDGGRDAHVELGRAMAAATRQAIRREGLWPKNLPYWPNELHKD